jgi:hypothetical protein
MVGPPYQNSSYQLVAEREKKPLTDFWARIGPIGQKYFLHKRDIIFFGKRIAKEQRSGEE